jgi:hypothetical protein
MNDPYHLLMTSIWQVNIQKDHFKFQYNLIVFVQWNFHGVLEEVPIEHKTPNLKIAPWFYIYELFHWWHLTNGVV